MSGCLAAQFRRSLAPLVVPAGWFRRRRPQPPRAPLSPMPARPCVPPTHDLHLFKDAGDVESLVCCVHPSSCPPCCPTPACAPHTHSWRPPAVRRPPAWCPPMPLTIQTCTRQATEERPLPCPRARPDQGAPPGLSCLALNRLAILVLLSCAVDTPPTGFHAASAACCRLCPRPHPHPRCRRWCWQGGRRSTSSQVCTPLHAALVGRCMLASLYRLRPSIVARRPPTCGPPAPAPPAPT